MRPRVYLSSSRRWLPPCRILRRKRRTAIKWTQFFPARPISQHVLRLNEHRPGGMRPSWFQTGSDYPSTGNMNIVMTHFAADEGHFRTRLLQSCGWAFAWQGWTAVVSSLRWRQELQVQNILACGSKTVLTRVAMNKADVGWKCCWDPLVRYYDADQAVAHNDVFALPQASVPIRFPMVL